MTLSFKHLEHIEYYLCHLYWKTVFKYIHTCGIINLSINRTIYIYIIKFTPQLNEYHWYYKIIQNFDIMTTKEQEKIMFQILYNGTKKKKSYFTMLFKVVVLTVPFIMVG